MSIGRRKVRLEDEDSWIFNRMVDAYESRPEYPDALIEVVAELAGSPGARVCDVGAGLGHLALPLAQRGFAVTAVEPAIAMLRRLREVSLSRGLPMATIHGAAEHMPLADGSADLVLISDAVHFLDTERAAYEVARVLAPRGALAIITAELSSTPFMNAVVAIMQDAAPRRPREVSSSLKQLLSVAGIRKVQQRRFDDERLVDADTLEGILRSISFIGPAMNAERYAAFRERIHAIEHEARWARSFHLSSGTRGR